MVAQSEQPWDQGLDPKSLAIAGTTGPGDGKTFNLMHRVARLLQEGKDVAGVPQRLMRRNRAGR